MKTILIDMDSILADFYFGILNAYEAETGVKLPPNTINTWDYKLPNGKNLVDYFGAPGFFRGLKPIPGAVDFIRKAKSLGHDVLIVTSSTLTNGPGEKFEWLQEHFPDFDRKQVVFATRKDRVIGDVLIDDHPHNTAAFKKAQPNAITVGIEYPYNALTPESFSHLASNYLNFREAWHEISRVVLGE